MMSPGALGGGGPPPMMSPGALGGGGPPPMVAQPGMVAPPPMFSPGGMSGAAAAPPQAMNTSGPKVLVGFLVTFQNDPGGSFWPIHSGRTQLGRSGSDGGVDVPIPDGSTSSRHATVHADPSTGQAFVDDDNSRNGTFLNEQKLVPGDRRHLRDNDRIRLGSTTFVVKLLVS